MTNEFDATSAWFAEAKQQPTVPAYDATQATFYLGMQLEETVEKLELMVCAFGDPEQQSDMLDDLREFATLLKSKDPRVVAIVDETIRLNPEKWVDADADLIWVSLGAIRALGVEPRVPYNEVTFKNWDKRFSDGTFHHDANGKVIKRPGWTEPDHTRTVAHLRRPA